MTNGLSKETVQKLISGLDEEIETVESRLVELNRMKNELQAHIGDGGLGVSAPKRRLPPGLPKKLVVEALKKHKRLSIGEIMRVVKDERNYTIRDGSTRRSLDQLMKAGMVVREEDGAYRWVEGELL